MSGKAGGGNNKGSIMPSLLKSIEDQQVVLWLAKLPLTMLTKLQMVHVGIIDENVYHPPTCLMFIAPYHEFCFKFHGSLLLVQHHYMN